MTTRLRKPAVAGLFYPDHPPQLLRTVQGFLGGAEREPEPARAAMAPHAGYVYSGRTAGRVLGALDLPRRVICIGPNHTGDGHAREGGSVFAVGVLRTPIGDVPVDETLAADLLARCPILEDDPDAHRREHAVEVMLPFLLARRPDVAVVPVILAFADWPRCRRVGEALAEVVREAGEPVLLLISSDMNHYEPAAVAMPKDRLALDEMERLDGEALLEVTRRNRISMCGRGPAAAILHAVRLLGGAQGTVVDYSHSGMVSGDNDAVVGYAGVIAG
jgi:AmmeMemoRadiSam system protein B